MSEQAAAPLASIDDFERASDTRYTVAEVPFLGSVRLRSLRTSEYMKVAGKESQSMFAFSNKKKADGERLLTEAKVMKIAFSVVDAAGANHLNTTRGRNAIAALDYGVLRSIEKAVDEHCGTEGDGLGGDEPDTLEDAGKNSERTPGDSSSTD
jgi:hypothetical protein